MKCCAAGRNETTLTYTTPLLPILSQLEITRQEEILDHRRNLKETFQIF